MFIKLFLLKEHILSAWWEENACQDSLQLILSSGQYDMSKGDQIAELEFFFMH